MAKVRKRAASGERRLRRSTSAYRAELEGRYDESVSREIDEIVRDGELVRQEIEARIAAGERGPIIHARFVR